MDIELLDALRKIELFKHLSANNLMRLADLFQEIEVDAKRRITLQGQPGVTLFIVKSGEVTARRIDEHGRQRPVCTYYKGDYFGITSIFLGEPRDATVTANTDSTLWAVRRGAFTELLDRRPFMRLQLNIRPDIRARLGARQFSWQEKGESVVLQCRRHWVWFVRKAWRVTLALLIYTAAVALLYRFADVQIPLLEAAIVAIVLYSLAIAWIRHDWSDDYFLVTTHRLSQRERRAFIFEALNSAPLDRVQSINTEQDFLGRWLEYGTLTIETAADVGDMVFPGVPKPEVFEATVWEQLRRLQAMRRATERHKIRDSLAEQIEQDPIEALPEEDGSDLNTPFDRVPVARRSLQRAVDWIMERDIIPRTRIEAEDAITWRKHRVFLVAEVALPFTLTLACALLAALGFMGEPPGVIERIPWWPWLATGLTAVAIAWLAWAFEDWGNDQYIVTEAHIVDIEQRPFFGRLSRREASLGAVQNVQLQVPGFWATSLGYGNVIVQTAGSGDFTFNRVADPHQVQAEIFRRMQAFRRRQEEREAARRRQELAEWFDVYDEMRTDGYLKRPKRPPTPQEPEPPEPDRIEVAPPSEHPPLPEIPPPPPDPDLPGGEGGRTEF